MLNFMDTYNSDIIHHPQYVRTGTKYSKFLTKKMHAECFNLNIPSEPCRVCGFNKNTGRNFGVITCSTCKAFFRRNGRTDTSLPPCRFGGRCSVNERTRRQCPTCRLAKCFAVGMQKDLIRTDEERAARLELVRSNRLQRREKLEQQFQEQFVSINQTIQPILSSNHWTLLLNIRTTYERICLYPILHAEEEREEYLNTLPIKCRLKENSFLNNLKLHLNCLNGFFRTIINDLSIVLNRNDRQWLIKANLRYILLFLSMDLMSINSNQIYFDKNHACHYVYLYVFGQDLVDESIYLVQKLYNLIGFDSFISKLVQILLFLGPCLITNETNSYEPKLNTIVHIKHLQDYYTHLLWLYLIYSYGERVAERMFMSIIGQVLQHQNYNVELDRSLYERQPFGNLVYSLLTTFSSD